MSAKRFINFDSIEVRFDHILFLKLFIDENFRSMVMPILEQKYFNPPQGEFPYDLIFKYFNMFFLENQTEIKPIQILHAIQNNEKYLDPDDIKRIKTIFKEIFNSDEHTGEIINEVNNDYLIKEVEKFAQESAIELALMEAVTILGKKPENKMMIRGLLDDALAVQLNHDIGLNYLDTARERFTFYQTREDKIPFLLEGMNKLTFNGFARKTLNVFMAGTGIGKTLIMTSLTTDYIQMGYNVLYITMEITEKLIALRNDANILNIPIGDFGRFENGKPVVSVDDLVEKFENIKRDKKLGKLKIKEYATGTSNSIQIKALLKEIKLKEGFVPDVVIIDYINLMNSSRLSAKTSKSYEAIKAIAEELRGIAMEENLIFITATQTNREGINGNEVSLDKVSESAGLPHTSDFFCGIFQSEEQREQGIYVLKILKSRYASNTNKKIAMGVSYDFMRFYQLDVDLEKEEDIDECDTELENEVLSTTARRGRKR